MEAKHFNDTAVVFTPQQRCDVLPLSPELYDVLDQRYGDFRGHALVALHAFTKDWPSWEIHPKGDEIVCLISGEIVFELKTDEGIQSLSLSSPGAYLVVPANTWHTARVAKDASCLFFTPGEGTSHADAPIG